jgi:hypothetical protein
MQALRNRPFGSGTGGYKLVTLRAKCVTYLEYTSSTRPFLYLTTLEEAWIIPGKNPYTRSWPLGSYL